MKQKAETYKKKRIVMGDENLVTNSEIHIKDVVKDLYGDVPSGGGGTSQMEYWSVLTSDQKIAFSIAAYCQVSKWTTGSSKIIGPAAIAMQSQVSAVLAIGFDRSARFYMTGQWLTFAELLEEVSMEDIGATRITEEEFYTIN